MATYGKALMRDKSLGVALYCPTPGKRYFRITGPQGDRHSARLPLDYRVRERDGSDDEFVAEQRAWAIEAYHGYCIAEAEAGGSETAPERKVAAAKTVNDLIAKREEELAKAIVGNTREPRTLSEARTIHRIHISPVIGKVRLRDWTEVESEEVMARARKRVGAYRQQAIGAALRALVTSAHAGRTPWIPRSRDPMHGVDYDLRLHDEDQDENVLFIEPRYRPSTAQVEALRKAFADRCRQTIETIKSRPSRGAIDRDYGDLMPAVAAYAGLRDGEVKALTAYSVVGHGRGRHQLHLIHACKQDPRSTRTWFGPLKKKKRRYAVLLPDDVWDPLEQRARSLLERFGPEQGMAALLFPQNDHNLVWVENTDIEQRRRGGTPGRWEDQDLWERASFARVLAKPAMRAAAWPGELDWNCLRHHFAVWARDDMHWPVEDISRCMGHANTEITMRCYFVSSADANEYLIQSAGKRTATPQGGRSASRLRVS